MRDGGVGLVQRGLIAHAHGVAGEERLQRRAGGRRMAAARSTRGAPANVFSKEFVTAFCSSSTGNAFDAPTSLITGSLSSICLPPVAAAPAQ